MNKKITAITAFMLLCAFVVAFWGSFLSRRTTPALAQTDEQPEVKTVYLTFDDGPSDRVTPVILDILKQEGVPATFFIIGQQALTRPYLIEREIAEGHTVAVHSYSHDYHKIYADPQAIIDDIEQCNNVLYSITGKRSTLYRFPGGSYGLNAQLIAAVTEHGLRYIDWNASTRDAELYHPTAQQLYESAIGTSADINHIVLLSHDSPTKLTTAQALPRIIHYYREKGYLFSSF